MPAEVVGEQAAEERADDEAEPEDGAEQPLVAAALPGLKRSPMTASAIGKMAPAPRPWRPRKMISSPMDWESPESAGADQEEADADQQQRLAAVDVGELAVDRAR